MKGRKIAAIAITLSLVSSVGIFTSYSWLTSKLENSTLSSGTISVGNLELKIGEISQWQSHGSIDAETNRVENTDGSISENFTGFVPGSLYRKEITLKNTGSVNARVSVDPNKLIKNNFTEESGLKMMFVPKSGIDINNFTINGLSQDIVIGYVEISIPNEIVKTDVNSYNLNGLSYTIEVDANAIQVNAPDDVANN